MDKPRGTGFQQEQGQQAVTMGLTEHGQPVVVKRFDSAVGDSGQGEARWLGAANHPGIVRLVKRVNDPPLTVTEHVAGPTLRTASLEPGRAAHVLSVVADTLADLHQMDMFHGAVNPDHILVTTDQPDQAGAVLCSPLPSDDRTADANGLGRCIEWLVAEWEAQKLSVAADWSRLAAKLASEPPLDLRRAAHQLGALAPPLSPSPTRSPSATRSPTASPTPPSVDEQRPARLQKLAALVILALALLLVGRMVVSGQEGAVAGARLPADQGVFAVGQAADVVVALPLPCPGQPHALLLDRATDTVWTFEAIHDGAMGSPMTRVSGATMLVVEAASPCPRAWVSGPAGAIELDWP